jgi:hypothetical protein
MKASAVRLKVRVRLADGSGPFLDPVLSPNGKLKPQSPTSTVASAQHS